METIIQVDAAIASVLGDASMFVGLLAGALVAWWLVLPSYNRLYATNRPMFMLIGWAAVAVLVWFVVNWAGLWQ